MIRARSLATTCVRECVRSSAAAGKSAARRGGASAATTTAAAAVGSVRAFGERNLLSAQLPHDASTSGRQVHSEDLDGYIKRGQNQEGKDDQVEDLGDLLRLHACAVSYSLGRSKVDSPVCTAVYLYLYYFVSYHTAVLQHYTIQIHNINL